MSKPLPAPSATRFLPEVDVGCFGHPCTKPATLVPVGWLDRFLRRRTTSVPSPGRRPRPPRRGASRSADPADEQHLSSFAGSRRGVEGFVEPRTAISDVTLLLVAHDGEWTRRKVPSVEWAHRFANRLGIPSYDAAVVGYPDRMRDYNRRAKDAR
jgi:hypothetical protein